jgi:hypothetical protein
MILNALRLEKHFRHMECVLLVIILHDQLSFISFDVMPRVVNGECWFPFCKVLDTYFHIVRSTDILQIIKELYALPYSLEKTKPYVDPLLTFLAEVQTYISCYRRAL